ncbi:homoserine O-acetyltransferase family protein [Lacibacter sediminis]|uniref:Homoserine O-acetyltransferase n=1 Tax=Lacibacter sediminis TaxID=2760713 RepID=A0A7G5XJU8_9BACT|nr:homoserine O-acetyltransferase [Lacibacter sediminis]QNA45751.1 homoserine O-acetyltransferase [Lacibacter sediminis]
MSTQIFTYNKPFRLESGALLNQYHLAYTTLGQLNEAKDNAVWIFHALTANSDPSEWWSGLVGEGKLFDPAKHFIVCVNMPGSAYGSIGPLDINPLTDEPYYHDFPWFTTRDMIRAYDPLRKFLGIEKIYIGIGGSMGGQQLLEWAIEEPQLFEHIIPIATNAYHSAWGIAFNASQRLAIEADSTWKNKAEDAGTEGLKAARSIALLSYRHYDAYGISQIEESNDVLESFKSESYQRYQGDKLVKRYNAFSYYFLSKGMDSHNVGRSRISIEGALKEITARTLVIGISNDVLFPVSEQQFLANTISGASFKSIESFYGHDGFLLEYDQISKAINQFLQQTQKTDLKKQLIK